MIRRDPKAASGERHDLIVVGGGIYGACLAMEAARRGLKALLLERDDFGGATSWNSLRIVHGGLRYLQTLDLPRFHESVRERRWFLRMFPDLVRPLPCLMPLHASGGGLKSPGIVGAALRLNDILSRRRNDGVQRDRRLADGRMLSAVEARLGFPLVRRAGLSGAALWHDAAMVSPQRIVMEILNAACNMGASAINYVEAMSLQMRGGRAAGVLAIDRLTHESLEFQAPVVINAAGPWCRLLARRFDAPRRGTDVFHPSLAYNLLLDRPPLSECAVAVSSGAPGSRVYFLYTAAGGLLAGTEHAPVLNWSGSAPCPTPEQIRHTLAELNAAIPGLDLSPRDVRRVYCGLLPARRTGTADLARRPVFWDHGRRGGPKGAYSVWGVKFTTARLVAERLISRLPIARSADVRPLERVHVDYGLDIVAPDSLLSASDDDARHALERIAREESAITMEDLLRRRTGWLDDPRRERQVRVRVGRLFDGDSRTRPGELRRLWKSASSETRPIDKRTRIRMLTDVPMRQP